MLDQHTMITLVKGSSRTPSPSCYTNLRNTAGQSGRSSDSAPLFHRNRNEVFKISFSQLSLLTKFLTEVETCLKTGKIENATERKETKSLNNNVDETAKPNSNIEEIVKERKKVKVKKKVLVKKAKGEKTADPVKKDLLGNIQLFIQIQNKKIIQTNISQSQRG